MAEVWERQPGESSKAYAVFCVYRDLGPERSLEKVVPKLGKRRAKQVLERWSVKYGWVARVHAYDDYIERKKREEKEKAILEMAERHAREAMAIQQKALERLRDIDPSELSPFELIRWIEVAVKIERLSRGEPTEIGQQEVEAQVMSTYEDKLAEKALEDPEAREAARRLFRKSVESALEG